MRGEKTSAEWTAHMSAIQQIVARWLDGELTVTAKREAIARENAFFHGRERRSPATGEQLCTVGAPREQVPAVHAAHREPEPAAVQGEMFADGEEAEPWWQE
jgi:hypothetical protein